jgi:uncharacterized protein YecT (DUF1311 family)
MDSQKQNTIIFVGIVLIVASVFGSPYWAVSQIKSAAKHNDAKALAEYIDFPSVKDSLKSQINGMLVKEVTKKGQSGGLEALGAAMATAFVGPMIDAFVTPETLTLMMQGKSVKLGETPAQQQTDTTSAEDDSTAVEMGYESYSHFNIQVSDKAEPDKKVSFTLKREGLWSWKVATLTIPMPNENQEMVEASPAPHAETLDSQPLVPQGVLDEMGDAPLPAEALALPETLEPPVPAPTESALTQEETVVVSPSFDCTKAQTVPEHLICNDAELANLDVELYTVYNQAKQASNNADWFKQTSRAAHKWREANCSDKACLLSWYSERKTVLGKIVQSGNASN